MEARTENRVLKREGRRSCCCCRCSSEGEGEGWEGDELEKRVKGKGRRACVIKREK